MIKPYDTIEEFNVDSKAECDQLNLAKKLKQTFISFRIATVAWVGVKVQEFDHDSRVASGNLHTVCHSK